MPSAEHIAEVNPGLETVPDTSVPASQTATPISSLTANELLIEEILIDDEFNCREGVTHSSVFTLASDIERNGLQQPVSVRPLSDEEKAAHPTKKYALIMGFRRTKACEVLGYKTVPAMIKYVDHKRACVLNIGENLHRKDLTFWEEAVALRKLFYMRFTREEIAKQVSQSPGWVQRRLLVWQLPEKAQALVRDNVLGPYDLQQLYKHKDPQELDKILDGIRHDYQMNAKTDENGKIKFKVKIPKPYEGKTKRNADVKKIRTKNEVLDLLAWMRHVDIPEGPHYKVAAWCAGYITDQDVLESIVEMANDIYEMNVKMPDNGIPRQEDLN